MADRRTRHRSWAKASKRVEAKAHAWCCGSRKKRIIDRVSVLPLFVDHFQTRPMFAGFMEREIKQKLHFAGKLNVYMIISTHGSSIEKVGELSRVPRYYHAVIIETQYLGRKWMLLVIVNNMQWGRIVYTTFQVGMLQLERVNWTWTYYTSNHR